jgi:O-antigen ligase
VIRTNRSPSLALPLLLIGGALLALYAGTMIGEENYSPVVILLVVPALIIWGIPHWRMIILTVYPLVWAWTWAPVSGIPGLSPERLLAIPVFTGAAVEYILNRRKLSPLPFRAGTILMVLVAVLAFSLQTNPTPDGTSRLIRLLQKMLWGYLIFMTLSEAGEQGIRRFTRLLIVSLTVAAIGGLAMLLHFGTDVRLVTVEGGDWQVPSYGVIGLFLTAPISLLLLVEGAMARSSIRNLVLFGLFLFLNLITLFTLVRRETLILVPLALLVIVILGSREQKANGVLLLIVGVVAFFAFVLPRSQVWQVRFYDNLLSRATTTNESRTAQIVTGLEAFRQRPLTGYGLGTTVDVTMAYAQQQSLSVPSSPHNTFLAMLVETGLPGFLATVGLWVNLFYGIWVVRRNTLSPYMHHLVLALPAVMIFLFFQWNTGDSIRNNVSWTFLGLFWAVIEVARTAEPQGETTLPAPHRPLPWKQPQPEPRLSSRLER